MAETMKAREERPDVAGIVRRGGAAEAVRRYAEERGEGPLCFVGFSGAGFGCEQRAVMEVYGLCMCEAHGEEAASGALLEIAYDLEQELGRFMHPELRSLSPHLEHALKHGFKTLPAESKDYRRDEALLPEAFP